MARRTRVVHRSLLQEEVRHNLEEPSIEGSHWERRKPAEEDVVGVDNRLGVVLHRDSEADKDTLLFGVADNLGDNHWGGTDKTWRASPQRMEKGFLLLIDGDQLCNWLSLPTVSRFVEFAGVFFFFFFFLIPCGGVRSRQSLLTFGAFEHKPATKKKKKKLPSGRKRPFVIMASKTTHRIQSTCNPVPLVFLRWFRFAG